MKIFKEILHKCNSDCPHLIFDDGGGHMDAFYKCIKSNKVVETWKYKHGEFPDHCPLSDYVPLKIYKHEGNGHWIGSCIIVSAVSMSMAELFIRHKLDLCGLSGEELDIHEVKNANTQSTLIHLDDGEY